MSITTELAFLGSTNTVLTKVAYPNINWVAEVNNFNNEQVGLFRATQEAHKDKINITEFSKPIRIARYIAKFFEKLDVYTIDLRNDDIHFIYHVRNNGVELTSIYQEYENI